MTTCWLVVNYCDVQNPMDIRDVHGVRTDKVPGSRIEYDPFPGGFRIIPGLVQRCKDSGNFSPQSRHKFIRR